MRFIIIACLSLNLLAAKEVVHVENMTKMEEVVKKSPHVIIDFYADWCGPCKRFGPIFEEVSREYDASYAFIKLNIDGASAKAVADQYHVRSIPTIVFLKDGVEIGREVGGMDRIAFERKIALYFKK